MNTGTVTIKGQVVIPAKIRARQGIKKGTKVYFFEKNDDIIMRPLSRDYFEKMAGFLRSGKKLSKILLKEREQDRIHEDKK